MLCHSLIDNEAQTCAALVLTDGVVPILAPAGHAPLSSADQALLVATVNHHLAAHGAPVDTVHNDYRPDAFVDICAGCDDLLKSAQARAVVAATRADAPPPAWLKLWRHAFGAAVTVAPVGDKVTVLLRSAIVPPRVHIAMVTALWLAWFGAAVIAHALADSMTVLTLVVTAGVVPAILLASLVFTGPALVEVAVSGGEWRVRRARCFLTLRSAQGRTADVQGLEVRARLQ